MSGDPAVKQRFLEQARSLSERPKFVRYRAVTQLICDALAFGIRDEAEIFRAAYSPMCFLRIHQRISKS